MISNYEKIRLSQVELDLELKRLEALKPHVSLEKFSDLEFEIIEKSCTSSPLQKCGMVSSLKPTIEEENLEDKIEKFQTSSRHFKVNSNLPRIVGETPKPKPIQKM